MRIGVCDIVRVRARWQTLARCLVSTDSHATIYTIRRWHVSSECHATIYTTIYLC